jgi:serine/threonine protein kinase
VTPPSRTSRLIDDRYEVRGRLGEGGMAVVLAARDRRLARDVAIKMLRPHLANDPRVCERFAREAHAAATLRHPHIVEIYDVGVHEETPYIVMQLVPGQTLKQIIASDAPFHPDDVASLIRQIGNALDHAHAKGYIHRDIKPANILIDSSGRALVADFGIAKGLEDPDLTDAGGGFGTAAYMAPEQVLGQMATPATDIYASGVVAFEMLTGQLPFAADTTVAMAMRHVHDAPPPPSLVNPRLMPTLDAIVLQALDKNPTRRWASMHDFAQALDSRNRGDFRSDSPSKQMSSAPKPSGSMSTATVAVLVLIMAGLLIWFGLQLGNERPLPDRTIDPPAAVIETSDEPATVPTATLEATMSPPPTAAPTAAIETAPTIAPVSEQGISVPDLRGATIPDAARNLLQDGLRISVDRSEFSDAMPMNSIIAQDPAPGVAIEPGGVVRVTLSRGPSPFDANDNP